MRCKEDIDTLMVFEKDFILVFPDMRIRIHDQHSCILTGEMLYEFVFHENREWALDICLCFHEATFAVEINGGQWTRSKRGGFSGGHNSPQARYRDMQKMRAASQYGYVTAEFIPKEARNGTIIRWIVESLKIRGAKLNALADPYLT